MLPAHSSTAPDSRPLLALLPPCRCSQGSKSSPRPAGAEVMSGTRPLRTKHPPSLSLRGHREGKKWWRRVPRCLEGVWPPTCPSSLRFLQPAGFDLDLRFHRLASRVAPSLLLARLAAEMVSRYPLSFADKQKEGPQGREGGPSKAPSLHSPSEASVAVEVHPPGPER